MVVFAQEGLRVSRKPEQKDDWGGGPLGGGIQNDGYPDPDADLQEVLRRQAEEQRKKEWGGGPLGGGFRDDDGFS